MSGVDIRETRNVLHYWKPDDNPRVFYCYCDDKPCHDQAVRTRKKCENCPRNTNF